MARLDLGPGLQLPLETVTETFGLLAVRGAGKTNAARVMAEEMFGAGLPFVAIDPVGSWWGLRSSRDGKSPGLPIPIFGGKHGDVPLERTGGVLMADLVVDQGLCCVVDVSAFDSEAARKQFLLDFAKRLYQRNEQPLHLFLEEADDYIPQRPMRDEAQLLRAWENLVRRGRARGIGLTLITQRSAVLNKNVLEQVQNLIALRTTGPRDRDSIADWLKYHAQAREALESLPSLADGEAWLWSPNFLKRMDRVRFRLSTTFDSGETPKVGRRARAPATLADVDLAEVRSRMAATIEKAKAEDPKELHRQIAGLKDELRRARAAAPAAAPAERVEVSVLKEEHVASLFTAVEELRGEVEVLSEAAGGVAASVKRADEVAAGILQGLRAARAKDPAPAARQARAAVPRRAPPPRGGSAERPTNGFTPARQRILDGLAYLESIGVEAANRTQLALLADASPKSSGYANNLGGLSSSGLLEYPGPGTVRLTEEGRGVARAPDPPPSTEDLHAMLQGKVTPARWRILEALIEAYPRALSREDLAEAAGVSAASSGYANNLGGLKSAGLIDYNPPGYVVALPVLFLER